MTYLIRLLFCVFNFVPNMFYGQLSFQSVSEDSILTVGKTADFKITGDGSAVSWNDAPWIKLVQRRNTGSVYETDIKILYSTSGIYCLFKCEDAKITATLKGDFLNLWNEDVVEVFFWTDEKVPLYFEYELSPLNYELPILVPNNNGVSYGWLPWHYEGDRKTRHATRINRGMNKRDSVNSWTAEFFIPFELLRPLGNVPPQKGTRWRANFYRLDYDRGVSSWSWRPTRKSFHDYEKFGTLVFE